MVITIMAEGEANLKCSLCNINLDLDKTKGLNNCSHKFCEECFKFNTKSDEILSCPVCREKDQSADVHQPHHLEKSLKPRFSKCTEIHEGTVCDIYCETHNAVVCPKCVKEGYHASDNHVHVNLHTAAFFERNFLVMLRLRTAEKMKSLSSLDSQIQKIEEDIENAAEEETKNIDAEAVRLVNLILKRQATLNAAVDEKKNRALRVLRERKNMVQEWRAQLTNCDEETQVLIQSNDEKLVRGMSSRCERLTILHSKNLHMKFAYHLPIFSPRTAGQSELHVGNVTTVVKEEDISPASDPTEDCHDPVQWKTVLDITKPSGGVIFGKIDSRITVNSEVSRMAISEVGSQSIFVCAADTGKQIRCFQGSRGELLSNIQDISYMTDQNIAVIEKDSRIVRIFSDTGDCKNKFDCIQASDLPLLSKIQLQCAAADQVNHILLIGVLQHCILVFTYTVEVCRPRPLRRIRLSVEPRYLDISTNGVIAVSSPEEVIILSVMGRQLVSLKQYREAKKLNPSGVCFDATSQNLFVGKKNFFSESVRQFSLPSGRHIGSVCRELSGPCQLALLGNDKLAVTNSDRVIIYKQVQHLP